MPKDIKSVRQFMGLAGYFRRFIKGFSVMCAPITSLLKKEVVFNWTDECERIRKDIINRLSSSPVLKIFDPIHTDASSIGLSGVLLQKHDKTLHPVAYFSRRTSEYEAKYH